MFGWQQWRGPFPGNAPGIPPNAYGNGSNNGMGFQGGWVPGMPPQPVPPPSMMPPLNPMQHGGWQQPQMPLQNTGFGMGQGYGPPFVGGGGGGMMMNQGYGGVGGGDAPEMSKPPLPPQPPPLPSSADATTVQTTTFLITNPMPPPLPPPEETSGTTKAKDAVLLTEKEAKEKERLEQLKQQAQQWQKQMATIQQQATTAMAYTPMAQHQFMGGDSRFQASVTQQQPLQPSPQLPFRHPVDAPQQPIQPPQPQKEAPRPQQEPSRQPLETPRSSMDVGSSRPIDGPVGQKQQQVDTLQSGKNNATNQNNPKPTNKPNVEPLMSQRIPPPEFRGGGGGNMTIDLNELSVGLDVNRRQMETGRNTMNERGRMMDSEFGPGMRQQQMGFNQNERRTFVDDSLEEEYRLFRQRNTQQRSQVYDCGESNDEMLQMFRRSIGKQESQVNRGGMMPERSLGGPGPMSGQRTFNEPNQMGRGRGGPLLGQRPNDDRGPLLGQRSFDDQNRMGRGGPLLGQRFPENVNDIPRGGPLLGQRPFDDQNRMGPSFDQRYGENSNEMGGRGSGSFQMQRSFDEPIQMGRGRSLLGPRPNGDSIDMPRGGPILGQRPFDSQNQMERGGTSFDQRYAENPNEISRGGPLLGQRPSDDSYPSGRGGPLSGQRFQENPNEIQRGGGLPLGQRSFENRNEMMRSGPMNVQEENTLNRSGPLLGQRPLGDSGMMSGIRRLDAPRFLDDDMSLPVSEPPKRPLLGDPNVDPLRGAQPKRTLINEVPKGVPPAITGPSLMPQNVMTASTTPNFLQENRRQSSQQNALLQAASEVDTPEKVMEEFTRKLDSWNEQFQAWKLQNKDHPDREAYFHYEKQWQQWRDKLLDRHEQMKRLQIQRNLLKGKDPNVVGGGGVVQSQTQQQINIPSTSVNTGLKDAAVKQTTTVAATMPQTTVSQPSPLELAAKLLVGMAGPLLQNATSILSANKGATKLSDQNKKDSNESTAQKGQKKAEISTDKVGTNASDYTPADQPVDMVLDSDEDVDFAADNFDSFEPATQISEKNAKGGLETEESSNAPIGLVHPGPWKPLFSTNLSSDMPKPERTEVMTASNTSSESGKKGQGLARIAPVTSDRVREKPKDSGQNARDAPFDFRDMLKKDDKDESRDNLRGWHLLVPTDDDHRGNRSNNNKRRGQDQDQYGRQSDGRSDFDGAHNRSRFETDRSYDGNNQLFLGDSLQDSSNTFERVDSIPFAERTDVWDNPYLHDDDEVPFFEDNNDDAPCTDAMEENWEDECDTEKSIPPLFPNNDINATVPSPMMPPGNKPLTKRQRKRLRSRWGKNAGDPLQNPGELQKSTLDHNADIFPRGIRSETSDFEQRRMRENESRWFARGANELPPLADSGMINRSLTDKEQDIIRKAAEELKSLQDRMEEAMPPPQIYTLDCHQIILQPKGRNNQPAVNRPRPRDDEPIEVGRVVPPRIRDWNDGDRDVSIADMQRKRNLEEKRKQQSSGSGDVEFLNKFWDRRSSEAGDTVRQMDRNRGFSSRDSLVADRGFSSHGPDERGFSSQDPEDRRFSLQGPEDRGFFSRGPEDREFSSLGPEDRGLFSRGPEDRGLFSRGPEDRGFPSHGPEDRGFSSRGPQDRGFSPRDSFDDDRGFPSRGPYSEDRGFSSRGPPTTGRTGEGEVPVSIDYGHGAAKSIPGSTLIPGQSVFDYFEKMFNVENVQTIDYGHGRKEQSSYDREHDRYGEHSSLRDSSRNRVGREPERFRARSRERERSRERIREHDRSYDRSRARDRSIDRIYGRERERSRDRNRDQGRERDRLRSDRNRDDEKSRNRGNNGEQSQDRNRERDSRSTRTSRDVDKTSTNRTDDSREKNLVEQSFRARESQQVHARPPMIAPENKFESVLIEDLLGIEGRKRRPHNIVIVLRGPPGSGKTYVAKLIKDNEIENGGSAPRMLCLDDYFMVESEESEVDLETGKNVMKYEYEPEMEDSYRNSLFKSFKKTIEDGFFPFIIVDAINNRVRHFEEIFSFAKHKGFQVYVAEMDMDPVPCHRRNIHNRSLDDINKIIESWESTPRHYIRVDVRSLLQDAAITEVEMEDLAEFDTTVKEVEETQPSELMMTEEPDEIQEVAVSKWEKLEATEEKLAKLDGLGLMKRKKDNIPQSLEDYLQLPDDYEQRECQPGQKRVRWADIEERKDQEKKRAVGFVVGQTDWQKMTDPSHAEKALNRTKYI